MKQVLALSEDVSLCSLRVGPARRLGGRYLAFNTLNARVEHGQESTEQNEETDVPPTRVR